MKAIIVAPLLAFLMPFSVGGLCTVSADVFQPSNSTSHSSVARTDASAGITSAQAARLKNAEKIRVSLASVTTKSEGSLTASTLDADASLIKG